MSETDNSKGFFFRVVSFELLVSEVVSGGVMALHYRCLFVICCFALLLHAQTPQNAQASLAGLKAKYDAPFSRNLESFDCAVEFNWKDHFKETYRVGDEGTDAELEQAFQPIKHRVLVTRDQVTPSSGMTDLDIGKLPHGGVAEFLLEHAIKKTLFTWLPAATNTLIPDATSEARIEESAGAYKLSYKVQDFNVDMMFAPGMRLTGASVKGSPSDGFTTTFVSGKQGFLLSSWTLSEDGNLGPGHRLIFSYTYQTVNGFQIPEQVALVRESHHEVWRYKLSKCVVKAK